MRGRSAWEALHQSFRTTIRTYRGVQAFRAAAAGAPALARFSDGEAVVAFLAQRDGDPEAKQAVLEDLVRMAQGAHQVLGTALLWLGLWPGLDAVFRRGLRLADAHEVVSDISMAFTAELRRIDLSVVRRVAATLVRNTERALLVQRKRDWKRLLWQAATSSAPAIAEDRPAGSERWQRAAEVDALQAWQRTSVDQLERIVPLTAIGHEPEWFLRWLREVLGRDARLVVSVVVWEQTQHEAGRRQHVSHEAARKRFRRALARVRARFAERVSQEEGRGGVSGSEEGPHGCSGTNGRPRAR
ncbi:MAG: hypothetical protein IPI49_19570 [Myxococcales bacterium]|nr:hypothetical protein [Myxococcales bacterium]